MADVQSIVVLISEGQEVKAENVLVKVIQRMQK